MVENCARAGGFPAASLLAAVARSEGMLASRRAAAATMMTRCIKPLGRADVTRPPTYPSLATAANVSAISGTQLKSLPQDTLLPVLADAMILASRTRRTDTVWTFGTPSKRTPSWVYTVTPGHWQTKQVGPKMARHGPQLHSLAKLSRQLDFRVFSKNRNLHFGTSCQYDIFLL